MQALGTMTAMNTAVVRSQVDGVLKSLRFTEGQQVQSGQLLAEIDSRAFDAQLNQALGQLARDNAQLLNAQLDLQRYQDLLKKTRLLANKWKHKPRWCRSCRARCKPTKHR